MKRNARNIIIPAVIVAIVSACLYGGLFLSGAPSVDLPPSARLTQPDDELHAWCASALCQYYRSYQIESGQESVVRYYLNRGWRCREIRSNTDLGVFQLQKPYWECDGSAFPRGQATVGIAQRTALSDQITVIAWVTWK
jgi:hypothetical protein